MTRWKKSLVLAAGTAVLFGMTSGIGFVGASLVGMDTASAQENQPPQRKTRRTPAMREQAFKRIEAAQIAVDEKNYAKAREELDKLARMRGVNSYELAMMWNFRAYLAFETDDYPGAINAYKNVLQQADLPLGFEDQIKFSLAQLYFVEEDYRESLRLLEEWMRFQETPSEQALLLQGQAYYQLREFDEAIPPIRQVISLAENRGAEVKENWWLLLLSMFYEKEDMREVRNILEVLVLTWPKPQYWLQLASAYGELREDAKQLATMEIAYMEGALIEEKYVVNLARLYQFNEIPIKAARVMEKGFGDKVLEPTSENYELFANSLVMAKEFDEAIPPMERAAALAEDGEIYVRLASVYMERDRWDDCTDAIDSALEKGDLDRPDSAQIVKGMCHYNGDNLSGALEAFRVARRDQRSRPVAANWISFLTKEVERRRQIAQMSR